MSSFLLIGGQVTAVHYVPLAESRAILPETVFRAPHVVRGYLPFQRQTRQCQQTQRAVCRRSVSRALRFSGRWRRQIHEKEEGQRPRDLPPLDVEPPFVFRDYPDSSLRARSLAGRVHPFATCCVRGVLRGECGMSCFLRSLQHTWRSNEETGSIAQDRGARRHGPRSLLVH